MVGDGKMGFRTRAYTYATSPLMHDIRAYLAKYLPNYMILYSDRYNTFNTERQDRQKSPSRAFVG